MEIGTEMEIGMGIEIRLGDGDGDGDGDGGGHNSDGYRSLAVEKFLFISLSTSVFC